ncbi:hypothetical protein FOL47_001039 [Perkinsus chesapeaki]|uniref:Uncharacterized protein n=1 Tax=Perkinsus chesapeaki TaxID=330153 RepID=A0A7J6KTR2_PERCH|nr:hypothetical protein FOL47_001039 [Perkinsus chesapeaki]
MDFISHGSFIETPSYKLANLQKKIPLHGSSYSQLLSVLGVLEELPTTPAWVNALKHVAQSLVVRERYAKGARWSSTASECLRSLICEWQALAIDPTNTYRLPRMYDFNERLIMSPYMFTLMPLSMLVVLYSVNLDMTFYGGYLYSQILRAIYP